MSSDKPIESLREMLAYILSRQIEDHEVVYIGTGLPMVADNSGEKKHTPRILLLFMNQADRIRNISKCHGLSAGLWTWRRKAPLIMEMSYSFGQGATGLY